MPHILINGKKFEKKDFELESEFEKAVIENSMNLFGQDAIYIDVKKLIGTDKKYHKGIPDGYLIDFVDLQQPQLYFVENELSAHDIYGHITEQIGRFSAMTINSTREVRDKLLAVIREDAKLMNHLQQRIEKSAFHNLDNLMDFLIEKNQIKIVVVVDEETNDLNSTLNIFRQRPDVVTLQRYEYQNETVYFYQPMREEVENQQVTANENIVREFDTVVCPAFEDGFKKAYLEQNAWWAIRLSQKAIEQLKYLAIYEKSPVAEIKHLAEIDRIEPYKDSGKYILYLKNKIKINPVKLGKNAKAGTAPQGSRYTTLEKLSSVSKLSELWGS
ncbi:hypothetical protein KBC89_04285 [Candidatus Woesebacteria bacterium]|nr:hypothetical protein [Candidatus Woesebacteria bacterium]